MELGRHIAQSRKKSGLTLEQLGHLVGIKKSALSVLENGKKTGQPDPELVVKIAKALNNTSILTTYLKNNPAYQAALPNICTELSRDKRDPSKIFSNIATRMAEGAVAADTLSQIFLNIEQPQSLQEMDETLLIHLEQLLKIKKSVDTLEFELIDTKIL